MSDYQSQISKSSNVNVRLQGQPGYYTLIKCANSVGYFALLFLTWRFFTHKFDWKLGTGCLIVSTGWLMITRVKLDHLLQSYFDLLSRIEMQLPVVLGTGLSTVAILAPNHYLLKLLAVAEIVCWIAIFVKYRLNKAKFIKQGHGPVPKGTWITPPESVLRPGDLILTSGNVATELHESVGHAEMYLRGPDGAGLAFSSYMVNGAIIQPFQDAARRTKRGHYIALHLAEPWSEQRAQTAYETALEMVSANQRWAAKENEKLHKFVHLLPLPEGGKTFLEKVFHASGYDWFGTFMGRLADDRWTCIGACVELYHRMGVRTNSYGTGLLGFGTTVLDPILPVRFLADPAFRLIMEPEGGAAVSGANLSGTGIESQK